MCTATPSLSAHYCSEFKGRAIIKRNGGRARDQELTNMYLVNSSCEIENDSCVAPVINNTALSCTTPQQEINNIITNIMYTWMCGESWLATKDL